LPERHLEGGHIGPLAGGVERKLVTGELALGAQGALVQPIAGLILGRLVQGPGEALPVQRQIEGQIRVEGRKGSFEIGAHRPLGLECQPKLAHRTVQDEIDLLPLSSPSSSP
jgi:hypothetical protein